MQETEQKISEAYNKLHHSMPSIGFFSRKKRIQAFIDISKIADYMVTTDEVSAEEMLFIFSLLMRKLSSFQKSATMTAMSLDMIGRKVIAPIGVLFIVEVRKNLNLAKTVHFDDVPAQPVEEKR